jgi:hypothetical protein
MPLTWIPTEPPRAGSAADVARGRLYLRYEDICQDGRMVVEALPNVFATIWRHLAAQRPVTFGEGVVAILSRVAVEGGEGPISVNAKVEAEGFYHLARTVGPDGQVERLILAMWGQVVAPLGRTHGPPPEGAGRPLVAGRAFAEHVFTRPFAPPAQRKVLALEVHSPGAVDGGGAFVPDATYTFAPPESALALPLGAEPIDDAPVLDDAPVVFGLDHTDSNLHVNSLVYPRLFIEAALRRFAHLGRRSPDLLARRLEMAFRKPCFAGDAARVASRAFTLDGKLGVTAAVKLEGDAPEARPRCAARILFGGA